MQQPPHKVWRSVSPALLWLGALILYANTFARTPRLFESPECQLALEITIADIPQAVETMQGRPNVTDVRKHLLYLPLSALFYLIGKELMPYLAPTWQTGAVTFPGAVFGATTVVLAYFLFLRQVGRRRVAFAMATLYAVSYAVWFYCSVAETYSLTALAVALFLTVAFMEKVRPTFAWSLILGALIAVGALCDLRFLSLVLIPAQRFIRTSGFGICRRVTAATILSVCSLLFTAVGYEVISRCFLCGLAGVPSMVRWLPEYGANWFSPDYAGNLRSVANVVQTFLVGTITPVFSQFPCRSPSWMQYAHSILGVLFVGHLFALILGAASQLCTRLKSDAIAQAVALWLTTYVVFHIFYSPWSALLFAVPWVLPYMFLIHAPVIEAWRQRKAGSLLLVTACVVALANNVIVILTAWQLIQTC